MGTQMRYCALCQHAFQAPEEAHRRERNDYYCDACATRMDALEHHHSLSIDVSSLDDLNAITSRLFQACIPTTYTCTSSHSCLSRSALYDVTYWLSCTYDRISLDLLSVLASLHVRFTLYNTVIHQDVLRFSLDYEVRKDC